MILKLGLQEACHPPPKHSLTYMDYTVAMVPANDRKGYHLDDSLHVTSPLAYPSVWPLLTSNPVTFVLLPRTSPRKGGRHSPS
jgi:hypothetical protein